MIADRGVAVEHREVRPQHPAPDRPYPRRVRRGPASFSASSASRPQNASFFQPTAHPVRACSGEMSRGQVMAVQRVAHLGAQRVAGTQAGELAARDFTASTSASNTTVAWSHGGSSS